MVAGANHALLSSTCLLLLLPVLFRRFSSSLLASYSSTFVHYLSVFISSSDWFSALLSLITTSSSTLLLHKRMAAIHDRYTVLPPQRLRRPGALLRAVLRHKDSAGSGYMNSHQVNPQNRHRQGQGQGDTTSVGQVLQVHGRAASAAEHSHMHYINPYQFGVGGPDAGAGAGAAGIQLQGPPTAACTAPPAPPGALSPPSVPSIPAHAVILPPAQHLNPNFSPSNSIRHARSTSSPLPLVSPLVPSALDRRASRLSSPIATMPEYRHMRSGSLSIPSAAHGSSHHSMPRSPPSTLHKSSALLFAASSV